MRTRTNASNTGISFEKELEMTCAAYERTGVAVIRKVSPPARVIGGGASRKVIFLENPFLDFVGSWTAQNGRAIFIEAKSTLTDRLPIGDGGLRDKQVAALKMWHESGAAAMLIVKSRGGVFLLDYPAIQDMVNREVKSIHLASFFSIPQGVGLVLHDFLGVFAKLPRN